MKNRKVYVTTFCGVAVAMNIVLGIITSAIGIPLYLDTLGTVLSAAILGPVPGLIVGALSNIITGLIYSVSDIPFCLVNMAVGLVAKKWKFGIVPAIITGLALSFICPAIGTPIGIYVYGGLNGTVSDMLVMSLVQGGKSIFQASFLRNVASNLIDKVGTCVIGCLLIKAMPMKFLDNFKKEA